MKILSSVRGIDVTGVAVEFRLLGPVEVSVGEVPVPLGGVKPKTLLAALLLEQGHVLPMHRLIDILWPDEPPETAKAAIQTYVKTLRQALTRAGAPDVIVTRAPGYLARIPWPARRTVEATRR